MMTTDDEWADYDEFGMLETYAAYEGIAWKGRPEVVRRSIEVAPGQSLSAVQWGSGDPELVLLHGGGQNAHTWDSVALALDRPLIAVDLPGHGHSDWRDDRNYTPQANALAVASLLAQVVPDAQAVIGMSLGGLTNVHLASIRPDLVRRAIIVDVLPLVGQRMRTMTQEQRGAVSLVGGPLTFDTFDEMLKATAAAVPGRPIESLRTGVLHNAKRLNDGRWAWRYDRLRQQGDAPIDFTELWSDVGAIRAPMMLVRGGKSAFVDDEGVAKLHALQPAARIELVEDSGHSVQSDRPLILARLIDDFLLSTP